MAILLFGMNKLSILLNRQFCLKNHHIKQLKEAMEEATYGTPIQIDEMDFWENRGIGLDIALKKLIFLDFHNELPIRNLIDLNKIEGVRLVRENTSIILRLFPINKSLDYKSIYFFDEKKESQKTFEEYEVMAFKWSLIIQNIVKK